MKFAGFLMGENGYSIDTNLEKAVLELRAPENLTPLRSCFGLVNQLGAFYNKIPTLAGLLRDLLKTKNEFLWSDAHEIAFEEMKK